MNIFQIILLSAVIAACSGGKRTYYNCEGTTQGTMYHVIYEYNEDISNEIDTYLINFSKSLSNYDKNSVISKFNYNAPDFRPDTLLIAIVEASNEVWRNTDGAFDITIAPIANLWGFGWEEKSTVDTTKIRGLMKFVGMDKISISKAGITKQSPEVMIIGNGIAQGLSVDCLAAFLEEKGIENYLIEIGGEICAKGYKANHELWKIGIDKPINSDYSNRQNQTIISLTDWSLATSGNYRKFVEVGQSTYGHSLNPKTGYPANTDLLSVTVAAQKCMYADAYATAFMVMGFEKSFLLASKIPDFEAYFIYMSSDSTHQVAYTSGFGNFMLDE